MEPRDVLMTVNAAFSRRDAAAMVALYAPDAVVADHREGGLGRWQGHEELLAYYAGICDTARELREELQVIDDHGDVLVADCLFTARLSDDGPAAEFSLGYGLVVTIRDGLVQQIDLYSDATAAQAAAMPEAS